MAIGPLAFALVCGSVFILALGAIGAFLIVYGVRSRKKAAASQAWPSTEGWITSAEVWESRSTDDEGHVRYAYYPTVAYTYTIEGRSYAGKQISFGGVRGHGTPTKAQEALTRFPVGAQVSVYYDPTNPAEAVLVREEGAAKWALAGGIFCLALGACIACPLAIGVVRNLPGG